MKPVVVGHMFPFSVQNEGRTAS